MRDTLTSADVNRRLPWIAATAGLVVSACLLPSAHPLLLYNTSPSEPEGWYFRTSETVGPGLIIAFETPQPAQDYFKRKGVELPSLLKTDAAEAGTFVCAQRGHLSINRTPRAPIATRDASGRLLPRWNGCRILRRNEIFVLADRVPNSFDSRYFGPIKRRDVLGVFRKL